MCCVYKTHFNSNAFAKSTCNDLKSFILLPCWYIWGMLDLIKHIDKTNFTCFSSCFHVAIKNLNYTHSCVCSLHPGYQWRSLTADNLAMQVGGTAISITAMQGQRGSEKQERCSMENLWGMESVFATISLFFFSLSFFFWDRFSLHH